MYSIEFLSDKKGQKPVLDYIKQLAQKKDKDSRIKLHKIDEYIEALSQYGKALGEPYIKHINGDIWELRPLQDRILFAAWTGNSFILISHFVKKTQKTPIREIDKAKRLLKEYKERSRKNG